MYRSALGVVLACLVVSAWAAAPSVATPPAKGDRPPFADAPPAWRGYFEQAQTAEQMKDPLQRCLAYPDLPGNQWPEGHAAAHCRNHYDTQEVSRADIQAALDGGKVADLEVRLAALLDRHFDKQDPREDIHYVFDALRVADEATDALTRQWLRLAPDSAYAHLARAAYLDNAAWDARGAKYAAETPSENMRRMSQIASQAVLMYERAAEIQPRLLPAYEGLLRMATVDSHDDVAARAIEQAGQQDPTCPSMAKERMRALQPRWGGSYPAMLAYAESLAKLQGQRPHLAMYVGAPFADRGDRLISDKQYGRQAMEMLDVAVNLGTNEEYLTDAANVALNATDDARDTWKAYAYLLQAERFAEQNAWAKRALAQFLVRRDPAWGLRYAQRAIESDGENAYGRYLLGAAYYNTQQFDAAQAEYLLAAEDTAMRQTALRELSGMWLYDSRLPARQRAAKAAPHLQRLLADYPDDGRGWIMRVHEQAITESHIEESLLQTALKKADPKDPWQANFVRSVQELRARSPVESPRKTE